MTNIEQRIYARANGLSEAGLELDVANGSTANKDAGRWQVISQSAPNNGPQLVRRSPRKRVMGRKGRAALAKRRALDGAFLTIAIGVVALIWWSTL